MAKVAWGDYNYLRPGEGVEGWVLNQLKLPISCLVPCFEQLSPM